MRIERGKVRLPSNEQLDNARRRTADALVGLVADPAKRAGIAKAVILRALLKTCDKLDFREDTQDKLRRHSDVIASINTIFDFLKNVTEPYDQEGIVEQNIEMLDILDRISDPLSILLFVLENSVSKSQEDLRCLQQIFKGHRERDPLHEHLDALADQWANLGGDVSAGSLFREFAKFGTMPLWGEKPFPSSALTSAVSRFNNRSERRMGRGNPAFRRKQK